MFTHYSVSTVLVVALIGTFVPPLEGQFEPLAAEVEARLRASFAAWSAGDIETITSGTGSATGSASGPWLLEEPKTPLLGGQGRFSADSWLYPSFPTNELRE